MFVHANLDPIKAYVREDVLYNMDQSKEDRYVKCEIIGVSSYQGSSPTFQIVIERESLFSYIPPHVLIKRGGIIDLDVDFADHMFGLNDLVYHNCPDVEFAFTKLEYLVGRPISAFIKTANVWAKCEYLFTMDWYRGNDLLHCVTLDNGQFGFFPQHKLSLGKQEFKPYQKLCQEWRV